MSDDPAPDVISAGRDPDHEPGRAGRWRLLAGLTAAVLIAGVIVFRLSGGLSGPVPPPKPSASPSPVALAVPSMLHGTPLRPGGAPGTLLFLSGDELRLLTVRAQPQAPTPEASVLPHAGDSRDPLGPGVPVQQVIAVAGGVVALVYSRGPGGLPDIGDVLFVPVGARGAGTPRVIARANYIAAAPDGRDVWVEQAGAPWGNGPASSPAWLAGQDGKRLSAVRSLNGQLMVAATVRGLLVQRPDRTFALMNPVTGRAASAGLPAGAIIAGINAHQVAWQAAACPPDCLLNVTDVRGGPDTQFILPPDTAIDPGDTSDFDPAGQRLAMPLDTTDAQGTITGTSVYVFDFAARTIATVPGGPVPVAALPAVLGAFPAGSPAVVSVRWSAAGTGLWIVATDGLYFQAGYWTGHDPLRVLAPQAGLAYSFGVAGSGGPAA
jgi:hypothetical protein